MKSQRKKEEGVALMMVIAAIAILATLLVAFIFDIKINRFKVYNYQDKAQARLNAEAGLNMAMARLKLYKEGRNYLEKNKDASKSVSKETLNYIWNLPFIYPIVLPGSANQIQKTALTEFESKILISGEMQVLIENFSQKVNLNLLRIASLESDSDSNQNSSTTSSSSSSSSSSSEASEGEAGSDEDPVSIESELSKLIREQLEAKKAEDDRFDELYGNMNAEELVAIIKYYVSDKDSYDDDYKLAVADRFDRENIVPKFAPMSDLSELYLLPDWNDDLVNLIKDSVTVQGPIVIDFNKINNRTLKFLFPTLEDEDVEAFFKYRDDAKDPHYFENIKDVKSYMVDVGKCMTQAEFEKREKEFAKAGLTFGTQANVFKITSTGKFGRAEHTIQAMVGLPPRPLPTPTPVPTSDPNGSVTSADADATATAEAQGTDGATAASTATATPQPQLLLDPRTYQIKAD